MKKFGIMTTLDIEHDHKNYNVLLDVSQQEHDEDYDLEIEIEVIGDWYYDKGRTYGLLEDCYPSEFELEIHEVYLDGNDITELLTDDDFNELQNECEIKVFEQDE